MRTAIAVRRIRLPAAATQRPAKPRAKLSERSIGHWLSILLRPLAVLACNDHRGRQVLAGCAHVGLALPDEVAVVGVDNDEVLCELSSPPRSSIAPDTFHLGYESTAILDALMAGQSPPEHTILISPKELCVRLSSDVLAVEDAEIAKAVRFIRDHGYEGLTVDDLVAALAVSRAMLMPICATLGTQTQGGDRPRPFSTGQASPRHCDLQAGANSRNARLRHGGPIHQQLQAVCGLHAQPKSNRLAAI